MDSSSRIKTYREFWPFYLGEHKNPINRALHYIGTCSSIALLIYFIANQKWAWIPLALVVGYAFAWIGHFIFEKNRPATFQYPFWSFISDFKMVFCAFTGKLKSQMPNRGQNEAHQ